MKRIWAAGLMALLAGCGFHLRTGREAALPAALSTIKVTMPVSALKYPGLLLIVRHALQNRGVVVVTRGQVPTLVLSGESLTPIVVTINNNGGASAYLLNYAATFSLQGPHGRVWMAPRTVRVQREYTYDALNLLAMGRQQSYLQRRLRHSAARQIMWQLAAFRPKPFVTLKTPIKPKTLASPKIEPHAP